MVVKEGDVRLAYFVKICTFCSFPHPLVFILEVHKRYLFADKSRGSESVAIGLTGESP